MSLESKIEDEKAGLRRAIRETHALIWRQRDQLIAEHVRLWTGPTEDGVFLHILGERERPLRREIALMEQRLIDLETTECQDGLWYKRFLRPGEAREILDRSLAKG